MIVYGNIVEIVRTVRKIKLREHSQGLAINFYLLGSMTFNNGFFVFFFFLSLSLSVYIYNVFLSKTFSIILGGKIHIQLESCFSNSKIPIII